MTPDQKPETTGVDLDELVAELRTLRARVGELMAHLTDLHLFAGRGDGHETADKVRDCIAGVTIQLRADLERTEARAESAEAQVREVEVRVKELEAARLASDRINAQLRSRIEAYQAGLSQRELFRGLPLPQELEDAMVSLAKLVPITLDEDELDSYGCIAQRAESRIATLESQLEAARSNAAQISDELVALGNELAAAREEQGLEARLVEALAARDAHHSLQLRKHGVESWMGVARDRDWKERVYEAETLPALLRAILECEVKGG